jgi:ketosteroid isomerase-like protein
MRHLFCLFAILLTGCLSTGKTPRAQDSAAEQAQLQRRLEQIFDAAAKKDFPRLDSYHFYGPKFTKFAAEQPNRQDATAARRGEHQGLAAATELSMKAHDLKIDLLGEVGIATFVMEYGFQGNAGRVERKARATLVFVKDNGEWKIVHEHFSSLP